MKKIKKKTQRLQPNTHEEEKMIINGDCIEEMQKLIDEGKQVDSVVTDPPYHLTSIVERFGKEGSAPAKDKDGAFQ